MQVKWPGESLFMDEFNVWRHPLFKLKKHIEDKCDNIRKRRGNGRSAPGRTPHCIRIINILFKN